MTAIAALTIAGCSQNEVMDESPDANPAVGFDVYTGAQTKGTVEDNTSIKTGFGILAYATGATSWAGSTEKPNFMYNQKVEYKTNKWEYSPVRYWPKNTTDKITFFAYAPYESAPDAGTNKGIVLSQTAAGNPKITFSLKAADSMIDLLTDEAQTNKTKANTSGTVAFKFKHILSRVKLMAKAQSALATGTDIVIKKVIILGKTNHAQTKFYTQAVYTTALGTTNGKWAAGTQAASDYDLANVLDVKATGITGYTTQGIKLNNTTEVSLFKDKEYLFLIPVESFAQGDIQLKITYDIVTNDTSDATKAVASENTETVKLPASILAKGTPYKLTFAIGLDPITVTGAIDSSDDWGNESTGDLTN